MNIYIVMEWKMQFYNWIPYKGNDVVWLLICDEREITYICDKNTLPYKHKLWTTYSVQLLFLGKSSSIFPVHMNYVYNDFELFVITLPLHILKEFL